MPRATELQRQLVERHALAVVRPYFAALGLELHDDGSVSAGEKLVKSVWAGVEEPAREIVDLGAQIQAAEKLLDRVFGRPRQQLEHTGADGGPIELDSISNLALYKLSDDELEHLQELLTRPSPEA